jgi:hypothetical protein
MASKMSEPRSLTLPLSSADTAVLGASNATTNTNQGAGIQNNYTQAGGHGNIQYNAENQTIHHHGAPLPQGKPGSEMFRYSANADHCRNQQNNLGAFLGRRPAATLVIKMYRRG